VRGMAIVALTAVCLATASPVLAAARVSVLPVQGSWDVAEVVVNGQVVLRMRTDYGGYSARERAAIVAERIRLFCNTPGTPVAARLNGEVVVLWSGHVVATVDKQVAEINSSSRWELAEIWAKKLREALGLSAAKASDGVQEVDWAQEDVAYGVASWYGPGFHGRPTASGEIFDQEELTAAHRTLQFGTLVEVTNLANGRSVVVRINDRGPFVEGRIIDLSLGAARLLGMLDAGLARVRLRLVKQR